MLNTKTDSNIQKDNLIIDNPENKVGKNKQTKVILPNTTDGQRNRRMLANIQATLGGTVNLNKNKKTKAYCKKENYAFNNISEVLERIRLADIDAQISLKDISKFLFFIYYVLFLGPYLLANEKLLNKKDLGFLCSTFCESALLQSNSYYIVGLCVDLINNHDFLFEMTENLRNNISKFLATSSDDPSEIQTLPNFLAQLAVAKWPRGRNKAIEDLNPILYIVINTVMGWIQYVTECVETKEDDIDLKQHNLVIRCTEGLCSFCMVGQRSLWLSFPEIFDNIYEASKSILISNIKLKRSLKSSLLHLHLLLNKWSVSNTPKHSTIATQTIFNF